MGIANAYFEFILIDFKQIGIFLKVALQSVVYWFDWGKYVVCQTLTLKWIQLQKRQIWSFELIESRSSNWAVKVKFLRDCCCSWELHWEFRSWLLADDGEIERVQLSWKPDRPLLLLCCHVYYFHPWSKYCIQFIYFNINAPNFHNTSR
jgi:hypothetical protein